MSAGYKLGCGVTAYQGKVNSAKVQQLPVEFLEERQPSKTFKKTPAKIHKWVLQLVEDLDLAAFPLLKPSEEI